MRTESRQSESTESLANQPNWYLSKRVTVPLVSAFIVLMLAAMLAVYSAIRFKQDTGWTHLVYESLTAASDLRDDLRIAEDIVGDYSNSPNDLYGKIFSKISRDLEHHYDNLKDIVGRNPMQKERIASLHPILHEVVEVVASELASPVESRQGEPPGPKKPASKSKELIEQALAIVEGICQEESKLLESRRGMQDMQAAVTVIAVLGSALFAAISCVLAISLLNRQTGALREAEVELTTSNERMATWIGELEKTNRDIAALNEFESMLQACRDRPEAFGLVREYMERAFPKSSGMLCVMRESRNLVIVESRWGAMTIEPEPFEPEGCWALRTGHRHLLGGEGASVACEHALPAASSSMLCLPMSAYGETLGVLVVSHTEAEWGSEARLSIADTIARSIAMGLANLALRDKLLNQSITDQLTGLYNRRYLEDSLARELSRAERRKSSVSVLLLDVDHFKKYNDVHGHQAGDEVLKSLGRFLHASVRASDVACRYGGEEFAVIMPDSSIEDAGKRAESIVEGVRTMSVHHAGVTLASITLSIGVSAYPGHGETGEQLLSGADQALYRAKEEGRDRVCLLPHTS